MKLIILIVSVTLMIGGLSRCKEDLLENPISLTRAQENQLVAAEISSVNGGAMAEVIVLGQATRRDFYRKNALIDTALTYRWVNYRLALAFFTQNGAELPIFIPELTDMMVVGGRLTGDTTIVSGNTTSAVTLRRRSSTGISAILSSVRLFNGDGTDSSIYVLTENDIDQDFTFRRSSSYRLNALTLPEASSTYIPTGGVISGVARGSFETLGITQNYAIPYRVLFDGSPVVTVVVNDGERRFTLNLLTGVISG